MDADRSAAGEHGSSVYQRLNQILDEKKFDEYVEAICEDFYAGEVGRPGLAPGIYFRLLMVGYFEGIDSERGIASRASDSLSIRSFVRIALDESVPDHSTISRTRRLMDVETHQAVFQWVLAVLAEKKLLKGTTIGLDATTLEANAALRSIVRRDTGERYEEFLTRLAQESGIETPTRERLAKLDRKRPKKGSNDDWMHPHDTDARITKMKDGRTHLAHKAEHAVDMETGAIVAVTLASSESAMAKLGIAEIRVILCDEWTPAQVKSFRLLVNRSATWADFDEELLALELQDIQAVANYGAEPCKATPSSHVFWV